jgi:hypothetical protein
VNLAKQYGHSDEEQELSQVPCTAWFKVKRISSEGTVRSMLSATSKMTLRNALIAEIDGTMPSISGFISDNPKVLA